MILKVMAGSSLGCDKVGESLCCLCRVGLSHCATATCPTLCFPASDGSNHVLPCEETLARKETPEAQNGNYYYARSRVFCFNKAFSPSFVALVVDSHYYLFCALPGEHPFLASWT